MRFLFEAVLLFIPLLCAWNGYKKGLVMCIGTLLAIIISLYVGDLMGDTFSPEVTPVLRPFISGYMDGTEGAISESMAELVGTANSGLSVDEALAQTPDLKYDLCVSSFKQVGIYSSAAKTMATEAMALSDEGGVPLSSAIVSVVCSSLAYAMIFILFFLLVVIIITIIGNLFNLSFKIPDKEKLNTIGGLAAGALTGIIICMLITWALRFAGIFLPEDAMRRTLLTALFLKINFIPLLLTI